MKWSRDRRIMDSKIGEQLYVLMRAATRDRVSLREDCPKLVDLLNEAGYMDLLRPETIERVKASREGL